MVPPPSPTSVLPASMPSFCLPFCHPSFATAFPHPHATHTVLHSFLSSLLPSLLSYIVIPLLPVSVLPFLSAIFLHIPRVLLRRLPHSPASVAPALLFVFVLHSFAASLPLPYSSVHISFCLPFFRLAIVLCFQSCLLSASLDLFLPFFHAAIRFRLPLTLFILSFLPSFFLSFFFFFTHVSFLIPSRLSAMFFPDFSVFPQPPSFLLSFLSSFHHFC